MARKSPGSKSLRIVREFFPEVTAVADAARTLQVEVTKRDVSTSKRRAHAGCAMAVACKRATEADGMIISRSTAYIIKGKKATRYAVPGTVGREITAFDRGADFEAGVYSLGKPTHLMGRRQGGEAHSSNGQASKPRHVTGGIRTSLGAGRT